MLKLSLGLPTVLPDGIAGYARYRIDFENVDPNDRYALGWVSPRYPDCEVIDYLERIKGWWTGWNREIWQEDIHAVIPFKVRLYRVGLKDDLGLLEEQEYESLELV